MLAVKRIKADSLQCAADLSDAAAIGVKIQKCKSQELIVFDDVKFGGRYIAFMTLEEIRNMLPWVMTVDEVVELAGDARIFAVIERDGYLEDLLPKLPIGAAVLSPNPDILKDAAHSAVERWFLGGGWKKPVFAAINANEEAKKPFIDGVVVYGELGFERLKELFGQSVDGGLKFMVNCGDDLELVKRLMEVGVVSYWIGTQFVPEWLKV